MAMVLWLGVGILPFLILQALIAITLLEAVNYLEHYGMLRQWVGTRYERVDPTHSWNSNNFATNVLLYHLQRHSDHHANPTRRYQALQDYAESPVLPTGYAGMILLALVPPAWNRVMDPRVLAHFDGDVSRANISPRKRAHMLEKFPTPLSLQHLPAYATTAPSAAAPASSYSCPGCGYTYAVAVGDIREGFAPGTAWADIPQSWCCPDCGVRDKIDFTSVL
jgi:alkane 1-monooxygenase